MASPTFLANGNTPTLTDSRWFILQRILGATVDGGGGGGGGSTEVFFGSGDPNGVQTATRPAIFYSADGALWTKTNAGSNNTGWVTIVAA